MRKTESAFCYLVDVLNVTPCLSALLLAGWLGVLPALIAAPGAVAQFE